MTALTVAEQLLKSLGVAEAKEIDVEAIAFTQNATVRRRPLDGCEARIVGTVERAIITVFDKSRDQRYRYSVAHELGHWNHHRGRAFNCRPEDIGSADGYDPFNPERVADRFAADLLMPRYLFEPSTRRFAKMNLDAAEELSHDFNVSLSAAAIRLVEFGPAPAMVICHRVGKKPWFHRHPHVPETFFPKAELHPDSYAMDVWSGKVARSRMATVGADAWINHWKAERFQVVEQTFRTGRDRILTMVWWQNEAQIDEEERYHQRKSADYRRRG